jgi:hypothetical protein
LGTIQSGERQRCEEKCTASWGHYSGWPETALATDEGAVGGKKESRSKEVNVVCCYSAESWSDCGAVGFIVWLGLFENERRYIAPTKGRSLSAEYRQDHRQRSFDCSASEVGARGITALPAHGIHYPETHWQTRTVRGAYFRKPEELGTKMIYGPCGTKRYASQNKTRPEFTYNSLRDSVDVLDER